MSQLKIKVKSFKDKDSVYLVKAKRAIQRTQYQNIYEDVLYMKGKWQNNATPAYLYACMTNQYGFFEKSITSFYDKDHLNSAIRSFANEKRQDSFYESLFGMLLKGVDGYSRKSFGNLNEINKSVTEDDCNRAGAYLSKAVLMYPYFDSYLKKILPLCNPEVKSLIEVAVNDKKAIYSKYFQITGSLPRELAKKDNLGVDEKVLVQLISEKIDIPKLSDKARKAVNGVLLNLLEIRPDTAFLIKPAFFMSADDNVKKKYVDVLFTDPKNLMKEETYFLRACISEDKNFFNSSLKKSIDRPFNLEKTAKIVSDLLVAVREFDSKMLPVAIKDVKSFFAKNSNNFHPNFLETLSSNLKNYDGELKKEFIDIYRDTDLLRKELLNVKGVPNHLRVEAYFFNGSSKEDLARTFISKTKVTDITNKMASSVDFWKDYFNHLQKNSNYSSEIAKKLKKIKSDTREREVVDALLSSPNSISAVYLLAGDFSTVKQEEIDENLFNKVKLYPKVLFSVPNEFVGKVKDYIIIDAIKSFSSLSQKDNALALITKYPLNKSQDEELQESLRDKLIAGYVDILSRNDLSNNSKRRIK